MVDIICALCGKKQQTSVFYPATFQEKDISAKTYSARRKPDSVHYRLLVCQRCGLVFSSPILSPLRIANLYRQSLCGYEEQIPYAAKTYLALFDKALALAWGPAGRLPHPTSSVSASWRIRAGARWGPSTPVEQASSSVRSPAPVTPRQSLRVLEVGCGNGFFLKALMERGYGNVFGVEPSKKMVADAENLKKRIVADIFRRGQFVKDSFDVICSFHTLDHIVDVNSFMAEALRVVKKGGVFLAVVHDTEGLSVKLFGQRSPIFDIEHIFLFNKKTLRALLEKHGFFVVAVFDVKNTYPLFYWWRMMGLSENVLNIIGRIPVSLRAGNIAVVAKKP